MATLSNICEEYDLVEREGLGRHSYATATECLLEVSGYARNRPALSAVTGVCWNEKSKEISLKVQNLKGRSSLSGGGNGSITFDLQPGLYVANGCLCSGGQIETNYLIVSEAGLVSPSSRCFMEDCQRIYVDDYKAAQALEKEYLRQQADKNEQLARVTEQAGKILAEITEERSSVQEVVVDKYVVTPVFKKISVGDIVAMLSGGADQEKVENYIALQSIPSWFCENITAQTPEEVVEKIKAKVTERELSVAAAAQRSADLGLPRLSGTPNQIKWALQIRDKVAKTNPSDPRLKKATTAKYWIDNR